jgi:hypothetical protein
MAKIEIYVFVCYEGKGEWELARKTSAYREDQIACLTARSVSSRGKSVSIF